MGTVMNAAINKKARLIVLVEDDPRQLESMVAKIKADLPLFETMSFRTEFAFYEFIGGPDFERCVIVILDAMLPWGTPSPRMARPPPSVITEGIFGAGKRCVARVRLKDRVLPIIVYSALDRLQAGIPEDDKATLVLQKQAQMEPLIFEMGKLLH
jgi:hypothetical protein